MTDVIAAAERGRLVGDVAEELCLRCVAVRCLGRVVAARKVTYAAPEGRLLLPEPGEA